MSISSGVFTVGIECRRGVMADLEGHRAAQDNGKKGSKEHS